MDGGDDMPEKIRAGELPLALTPAGLGHSFRIHTVFAIRKGQGGKHRIRFLQTMTGSTLSNNCPVVALVGLVAVV